MPKKKKSNGRRSKPLTVVTDARTNIGVEGDVSGSVRDIVVGSHIGDTYYDIHIHQHGSPSSPQSNKELIAMIRDVMHSVHGARTTIPIETITHYFNQKHHKTFKDVSGKRMITFMKEHDKDFILEEDRNGNKKVSLAQKHCRPSTQTPPLPSPSSSGTVTPTTPYQAPPSFPQPHHPAQPILQRMLLRSSERLQGNLLEGAQRNPAPLPSSSSETDTLTTPYQTPPNFPLPHRPLPQYLSHVPRSYSEPHYIYQNAPEGAQRNSAPMPRRPSISSGYPDPYVEAQFLERQSPQVTQVKSFLWEESVETRSSLESLTGRKSPLKRRLPSTSSPVSLSPRASNEVDDTLPVEDSGQMLSDSDSIGTDTAVDDIFEKARDFRFGHFVLVTAKLPEDVTDLEGIANIPWQIVFDFDEESRDDGLLSSVERTLQTKRSLHISDWTDSPNAIRNNSTIWYFAKGRREKAETRLKDYKDWKKKVQAHLDTLLRDLSGFVNGCSVLTVVVLWNEEFGNFLNYLTRRLWEVLKDSVNVIVCVNKGRVSDEDDSYKSLSNLEDEIDLTRIAVRFRRLITAFAERMEANPAVVTTEFRLPTNDKGNHADISVVLARQLEEDLDVLYMTNQAATADSCDLEQLRNVICSFLKGDTLSWKDRYCFDTNPIDVKRDLHTEVFSTILKYLQKDSWKSTTFTLHHAPGSGGTTLSQRVLWELKDHFPCVQVHLARGPPRDVASKIDKLYTLTHLPVICLLDGEDEPKIKQLQRCLKDGTYIIFSVQRCPKDLTSGFGICKGMRHFWLHGNVSKTEAPLMTMKFEPFCEEEQKEALQKLCQSVTGGKKKHHLYEFGLTAFRHEFKGIQSLVKGYLQLNPVGELTANQTILASLSLVYYYGQAAIPCHFFSGILGREKNEYICIDDFNDEVRQLIVEEGECGESIRICHHLVAQEILEQVLTRGRSKVPRKATLSDAARKQLHNLAIAFIEYASDETRGCYVAKSPIAIILTRTFIFRDNKDTGQVDEGARRKKPVLGRLLTDIESSPPYEERLQVLQALTTKFPRDPNFMAHLGRFYSKYRPNEEEEATEAFERALEICKNSIGEDIETADPNTIDESMRVTLMHIYHMYGMVYSRRVGKRTGRFFGEKPELETTPEQFDECIHPLLKMTDTACHLFKKDRDISPSGQEDSYGYYGEISVRLQVCDFIHRTNPAKSTLGHYATSKSTDVDVKNFVKESIKIIDELFLECYSLVNAENLDVEFRGLLHWYNALFGQQARLDMVYGRLSLDDDIETRRLRIAAKKLKYSSSQKLSVIESITQKKDIEEIVRFFEANFDDVHMKGHFSSRKLLDNDYREWLVAIRHTCFTECYSLTEVLKKVKEWNAYLGSPFAVFYEFILHSMLGFGENQKKGSAQNLSIATQMKDDLQKHRRAIMKPRHPREWLGKTGRGIKRLVPGSRFVGHIEGRTVAQNSMSKDVLAVCKGTICKPNRSSTSGLISMDLGDNYIKVEVFFIPSKSGLTGEFYAEKRVEFVLGFSIDHGYEAFNVHLLKRLQCGHCSHRMEVKDAETLVICPKCHHKIADAPKQPGLTQQ